MPRLRISWLMAFVAFVAVEFAGLQALPETHPYFIDLAIVGIVPMLNVLGVSGLLLWKGRGYRPFLCWFLAFGSLALLAYGASSAIFTAPLCILIADAMTVIFGRTAPMQPPVLIYSVAAVIATTPQLVIASIGGMIATRVESRSRIRVVTSPTSGGFAQSE